MTYNLEITQLFCKIKIECGKREHYHILADAIDQALMEIEKLDNSSKAKPKG